jgi:hypothetical protein
VIGPVPAGSATGRAGATLAWFQHILPRSQGPPYCPRSFAWNFEKTAKKSHRRQSRRDPGPLQWRLLHPRKSPFRNALHVDLDELHNDSTTITFHGAYADATQEQKRANRRGRRSPGASTCSRPPARRLIDFFDDVQRHSLQIGRRRGPMVFTTQLNKLQRRLLRLLGMTGVYGS